MGRTKRKCVFEHVQNSEIQIHPRHAQNIIRVFDLYLYIL